MHCSLLPVSPVLLQAFEVFAETDDVRVIRTQQGFGHREGLLIQRVGSGGTSYVMGKDWRVIIDN